MLPKSPHVDRLDAISKVELTGFVGRRRELGEIGRLIGNSRLLTLTGPGGIGKTRVALRAAASVAKNYANGVAVVDVGELPNQDLLAQAVFGAVGLNDRTRRWRESVLSEFLHDKHMLLVFDDCERMLDACARLLLTLLRECPSVSVIATSRQPLAVNGEVQLRIPPLPVPAEIDELRTPEDALAFDSICLFVERAAASDAGFAINEGNFQAVAELCRRLDGIPLALELAAVRLSANSLDQLVESLDHELGLLELSNRGGKSRHNTLKATIAWSYQLLSDEERRLWTRLAVFPADFGLHAASYVCAGGDVKTSDLGSLIGRLVDKSMVIRQSTQGGERYRLLGPMRQFAAEQTLFGSESAKLGERLVNWVGQLAHEALSPEHQSRTFDRIHLERANLWKAIDECQRNREHAAQGLVILYELWLYFRNRGSLLDARRSVVSLLQSTEADSLALAKGLCAAGTFAVLLRDVAAGKRYLTESIRIGRALGNPEVVGWCLFHLSAVAWEEDDRAAEVQYAQQMLELSRAMQDEFQYSAALQRLGVIKIEAGDIEAGLQLVVEALAVSAKLDEEYFRSIQLWSIALGRMRLGELAPAERAGREALELATALGDGHSMSLSTECLAWIAAERRDAIKAAQLLGFASEMWRSMGTGLFPPLVPYRERCERYARAALGDTTFLEEFNRGKALSQAEVIGLAAHETPGKLEASVRPWIASLSSGHPALTARELEVGRMVAAGLTNKEIGAELLISTRTVEAHVGHVLTKLSLSSRIQLANWLRNAPVGDAVGDRRSRS